ncbi:MAG: HAD-IIB family hydrolase [Desulfobulbaceae bacterium]|nr:HAD-IIB family hydrolase [Desulfobulbaceae bacterium]
MTESGLYLQLFSIHGLIRGEGPELGRDADTGGQVKYVLELACALAAQPEVAQVDLVTRLIDDPTVSPDYAQPIEQLSDKARIVRVQCGGRRYIRKELLWPHLDEFVDKSLKFIKSERRGVPDFFHGHYADGGYVAKELASIFGRPFVFTGHSMGRHKLNKLLAEGMTDVEVNRRYRIDHRIQVEERIIKESEKIITSTSHEIREQYGLYENHQEGSFSVIPPGIDIDTFYPYYAEQLDLKLDDEVSRQARMTLLNELHRFWINPQKPFILALCRPDQRKNIAGLITAYGEDKELKAIANLAIFAGIRKDITGMEENERNVLTEMLLLMDQYDLYGSLAIPKKHDFSIEVPELYRLCADSQGVFVNPALIEPFGLTLIESAACGVPIIATREGGPADIIGNCANGILVDPTDPKEISEALKKILVDKDLWERYSRNGINGVREHYAWETHCRKTLAELVEVKAGMPDEKSGAGDGRKTTFGERLTVIEKMLVCDIDDTLVGDEESTAALLAMIADNRDNLAWGVATGRCLQMTKDVLAENNIPLPDIVVCSVGTEIFYGSSLLPDKGWQQHLSYQWKPRQIRQALSELDFLELQDPESQRQFKISYFMEDDPELLAEVHRSLQAQKLRYRLLFSRGQFLDILPYRASKGKAVRHLSYKWGIPMPQIMVCGNCGNDEDMLRGDTAGVVVANHSPELEGLKGLRRTFFSSKEYAAGIIDGIGHYRFLGGDK